MIDWRPHELAPQTWLIGYRDGEEIGSIILDHIHADGRLLVRRADGNVVGHCDTWVEAKARLEGRRPEKRSQKAPTSTSFRWSSLRDTHGARELSCDHYEHGFVGMVREREGGDWEAFDYANRSLGVRHGKRRAGALVTRQATTVTIPEWSQEDEMKIEWTKTLAGWTGKLAGETVGWVVEHETHFEAQTAAGGGAVLGQHGNAMRAKAAVEAAWKQTSEQEASSMTEINEADALHDEQSPEVEQSAPEQPAPAKRVRRTRKDKGVKRGARSSRAKSGADGQIHDRVEAAARYLVRRAELAEQVEALTQELRALEAAEPEDVKRVADAIESAMAE